MDFWKVTKWVFFIPVYLLVSWLMVSYVYTFEALLIKKMFTINGFMDYILSGIFAMVAGVTLFAFVCVNIIVSLFAPDNKIARITLVITAILFHILAIVVCIERGFMLEVGIAVIAGIISVLINIFLTISDGSI